MKNRGMIFTLTTIVILTLFIASYSVYTRQSASVIDQRVETLDSFLVGIEQDLERQLYIAGFRGLFSAQDYIIRTGTYISANTLQELLLNGTINAQDQPLMIGTTLPELNNALKEKASRINAEMNLSNMTLLITQESPWFVTFTLTTQLILKDTGETAQWKKTLVIKSNVPIHSFEDPLYTLNTNGLVTNTFRQTPITIFVSGSNVSSLAYHATNSYYHANPSAPSFLNRLQGNLTANTQGIESMVNLQELSQQGISTQQKTVIDYLYFSASQPQPHTIAGMPTWFRIDSSHASFYGAGSLIN